MLFEEAVGTRHIEREDAFELLGMLLTQAGEGSRSAAFGSERSSAMRFARSANPLSPSATVHRSRGGEPLRQHVYEPLARSGSLLP